MGNRYVMVLQKRYGGQEAVEFYADGEIRTERIRPFSDQKLQFKNKTDSCVQKNSLAFYDIMTNRFRDFYHFLQAVKKESSNNDYVERTSYLGYLNKDFMRTLTLSFNDPRLLQIASNVKNSNIDINDDVTMEEINRFINLIEDGDSDFVEKICQAHERRDKRFNFSKYFITNILDYYNMQKAANEHNKYFCRLNSDLEKEKNNSKKVFLAKIKNYKDFRELYRFTKQYLIDKNLQDENSKSEDDFSIREAYEKANQKNYQYTKKKVKNAPIDGQISLL